MNTALTAIEVAKLTAVISGGGYKRSASKEAAIARLLTHAHPINISAAAVEAVLAEPTFEAAELALKLRLAGGSPIADPDNNGENPDMENQPNTEIPTTEPDLEAETGTVIDAAIRAMFSATTLDEEQTRAVLQTVFDAGAASAQQAPDAKPARAPRQKAPREDTGPNKRVQAAALLQRPEGCTAREILDLTGWPAVSVPQLARSSGLNLRQEKDGKTTRYFGTAQTPA